MTSPLLIVVAIALVFTIGAFALPLVVHLGLRRVREPTATERDRIDSVGEGVGLDVDGIRIVETVGDGSVEVSVRGPPGYRTLFLTDYVLVGLREDVAEALLAAEAGRQAVRFDEYRVGSATVAVILGTASVGGIVPFSTGFLVLGIVAIVLLAVGRRLQYRADAIAADAVGADALVDAYRTIARLRGIEIESHGWRTYVEVQPPLGTRIRRLSE